MVCRLISENTDFKTPPPGKVLPGELVARICVEPDHYKNTGFEEAFFPMKQLAFPSFPRQDVAANSGASILRLYYGTAQHFQERIDQQVAMRNKEGYVSERVGNIAVFGVNELRSIVLKWPRTNFPEKQAFIIIDWPSTRTNGKCHATLLLSDNEFTKRDKREIRMKLRMLYPSRPLSAAEFFEQYSEHLMIEPEAAVG